VGSGDKDQMANDKEQIVELGNKLLIRAPAKINLSLLVAGKRDDGYHDIETIMAKINWYDELLFEDGNRPGIELICEGPHWAPEGEENLVYQACQMLLQKAKINRNVRVTLTKNIPAGSGLGSASSDAAAALIGLSSFADMSFSRSELYPLAASLGSDVPFFLGGSLSYCYGKGEKIREITQKFSFLALLLLSDVSVSTKSVYGNYVHENSVYRALKCKINSLLGKNRIDLVAGMCANMLEYSCFRLYPEVAELKRQIQLFGVGGICLSGSGSTIYCILDNAEGDNIKICQRVLKEKNGCRSLVVSSNKW